MNVLQILLFSLHCFQYLYSEIRIIFKTLFLFIHVKLFVILAEDLSRLKTLFTLKEFIFAFYYSF